LAGIGFHNVQLKLQKLSHLIEDCYMSNTIHQYGSGDNVAGDKVMGDKINTQINHSQNLAQVAKEITELLNQLDQDYDRTTQTGQDIQPSKPGSLMPSRKEAQRR
jgi:hypothetical protein